MSHSEPKVPVNGVVSKLREGLGGNLVAVVLLGSRTRGEAREGSDWDVLIVARHLPGMTLERAIQLKLAREFLEEAQQDANLSRRRSATNDAQLTVENAGKTVLALAGRIGRTYTPATQTHRLNINGRN